MPDELEFAPFMQSSVGAAIGSTATNLPAFVVPEVTLFGPVGQPATMRPPGDALRMLGPEGVVGLDTRRILRMDPPPGIPDTEPNYMASIEFDDPELPWLFTPARPDGDRLRPWLVLIAVETAGHPLRNGRPLPFVDVDTTALPPLGQSWQWAHVQRPAGLPGPLISRLLCPLRLRSNTDYTACVVPAFEGGRVAGLNGGFAEVDQHGDAWGSAAGQVRLPIYHSWRFRTGDPGDFEQLATAIVPLRPEERSRLAGRSVDITEPWLHGPPLASGSPPGTRETITVQGVLSLVDNPPEQAVTALSDFASRVARHIATGTEDTVAPPLYGGHPVVRDRVEDGESGWLAELNLNPETRIAASLGTAWVRDNQEWLMARAWEQVGAVREANRLRDRAAFCAEVCGSLYRRDVQTLTPSELITLSAPARERLLTDSGLPLQTEVAVSPAADELAAPALRRLLRRRGPVARRGGLDGDSYVRRTLSGELLPPVPAPMVTRPVEQGQLTGEDTDDLTARVGGALRAAEAVRSAGTLRLLSAMAPAARANGLDAQADAIGAMVARSAAAGEPGGEPGGEPAEAGPGAAEVRAFRLMSPTRLTEFAAGMAPAFAEQPPDATMTVPEAGVALSADLFMDDDPGRHVLEFGVPVDPDGIGGRLSRALDPGPLLTARLDSAVDIATESVVALPDVTADPVMVGPEFPAPMAMALQESAPDWFLPGSATIPDDRAVLLQANAPFIASFMVGVNDEMNREMRWREYPTDLRGSPFTHFWPRPDGQADIPPVHGWSADQGLSAQLTADAGELDVLLIRGLLVRRYPNMVVAAIPADAVTRSVEAGGATNLAPQTWEHPKMVLSLDERTCAYAFVLPGDIHDWWFVLAENSYRMRFGFDVPPADRYLRWSDVTWQVDEGGFADLGAMPALPDEERDHPPPVWNAATIAMVALQRPFRVLTSARNLIGDPR